ncbi:hypothetical protein S1001342_02415 [Acetobacter pasteurianus subsp. pasteurianus]|uniref:DUF4145 domain-containing protein n=1 Tax=Acetobacter pasteurianus subsp. pasteurianus TaxID=481145 RepID=A0A1Y0Y8H6_ACEPA|nr:hypothetical protein S1001342_02415 [Acetobacter pasteurianus subsp. pasteurianus]
MMADDERSLRGFFTGFCRECKKPFGGGFECSNPQSRARWTEYLLQQETAQRRTLAIPLSSGTIFPCIWPEYPQPKRFDYLPPEVSIAMNDAEEARCGRTPNRLVRGAYRTVIDVATQHVFAENLDAFKQGTNPTQSLNNRIDLLAAQRFLTPSLRDWAHGIRFITNEDVHTSNDVSAEEVTEIAEFTDMLLQYLFELPGRVKQAKETAEQKRKPLKII